MRRLLGKSFKLGCATQELGQLKHKGGSALVYPADLLRELQDEPISSLLGHQNRRLMSSTTRNKGYRRGQGVETNDGFYPLPLSILPVMLRLF